MLAMSIGMTIFPLLNWQSRSLKMKKKMMKRSKLEKRIAKKIKKANECCNRFANNFIFQVYLKNMGLHNLNKNKCNLLF